jgi:crossover junction endodeoxyribonuclease RuvC
MTYLGIDPGLKGAMVALDEAGELVFWCCADVMVGVWPAFVTGKKISGPPVRQFLISTAAVMVCIEQQSARPMQGRTSLMSIARQEAIFEGQCQALQIPYSLVRPQAWRKSVNATAKGENPKDVSLRIAEQLYPEFDFVLKGRRKPHDGLVDALLIARHCWKENRHDIRTD